MIKVPGAAYSLSALVAAELRLLMPPAKHHAEPSHHIAE